MQNDVRIVLTEGASYPIISQCDDVSECLAKAPAKHFTIEIDRFSSLSFRGRTSAEPKSKEANSSKQNNGGNRNEDFYGKSCYH